MRQELANPMTRCLFCNKPLIAGSFCGCRLNFDIWDKSARKRRRLKERKLIERK